MILPQRSIKLNAAADSALFVRWTRNFVSHLLVKCWQAQRPTTTAGGQLLAVCDAVRNCLWLATALRMTRLGTIRMCNNDAPVTGEVLWSCSQFWRADLSYVCPSAAITGSTSISCRKKKILVCPSAKYSCAAYMQSEMICCSGEWMIAKACNAELVCDSNNRGNQWYLCSMDACMCRHAYGCKDVTDRVTDRQEQKRRWHSMTM